jgi:hypothetical protein
LRSTNVGGFIEVPADSPLRGGPATGPGRVDARTEVSIPRRTNNASVAVRAGPTGEGRLRVAGETTMQLPAFGIVLPQLKLNDVLLRVSDELEITFDWVLAEPR